MANINLAYAAASDVTITLASLASDTSLLAGRESEAIDNTTTLYLDMLLSGKITTGTLPTNAKSIEVWAVGSWDGTTWPDVFDGTNSAETITSTDIKTTICRLVASISTDNTSGNAYHFGPTSLASVFGGNLPPKMIIFVTHNTGVALSATAGHHQIRLLPVYQTLSGSVPAYTLPTATNSVLGGVKIGSGVSITDGVISVTTDVYEYASESLFPATGAANTIYIDKDTSRAFRWTNSVYVEIGAPGAGGLSNVVASPSQITANQNDYAIGTADIFRVSSDAARTITGIVAGTSGAMILIVNVGSFAITLSHQSASSTAANRIIVPWAGDCVIAASAAVSLYYDGGTSRWRVL